MASPVALMTVLFTDLVGSTELRARLGEEAEDLRREYFALLRDALVAGDGEEVKTLGDGIMAAFPNASAALMCAVGDSTAASAIPLPTHIEAQRRRRLCRAGGRAAGGDRNAEGRVHG